MRPRIVLALIVGWLAGLCAAGAMYLVPGSLTEFRTTQREFEQRNALSDNCTIVGRHNNIRGVDGSETLYWRCPRFRWPD